MGVESRDQFGDAFGLVLAIAVDGDNDIKVMIDGVIEGCQQRRSVTAIGDMRFYANIGTPGQSLGGSVGGPIINDEDVLAVLQHVVEHFVNMSCFVVNRQCGERDGGHGRREAFDGVVSPRRQESIVGSQRSDRYRWSRLLLSLKLVQCARRVAERSGHF